MQLRNKFLISVGRSLKTAITDGTDTGVYFVALHNLANPDVLPVIEDFLCAGQASTAQQINALFVLTRIPVSDWSSNVYVHGYPLLGDTLLAI